jgi:YfiH family protein
VPPTGATRLSELAGRPVSWLRQVHGSRMVVVGDEPVQGEDGDALVTTSPHAVLAVLTADCAPVALGSPEGVVAAVHAGWAGLVDGVIERAVDAMRSLGASRVEAALGPCIHPGCYRFGDADLDRVAEVLGPRVRAETAEGAPALDLPAGVRVALGRAGASLAWEAGSCTSCEVDRLYSHRARGDTERQAMLVRTRG